MKNEEESVCVRVRDQSEKATLTASQPAQPLTFAALAFLMVMSCWAMTDRTSMSIRLNSSKQHQAPDCAKPLKKRPII